MTISPDIIAMFRETVTLAPHAGEDGYGKPTYGAGVTHRCRVLASPVRVRSNEGQEIVAAARVYLTREVAASTKDRVTLPGGAQPPILRVADSRDELGYSATVLYVGEAR